MSRAYAYASAGNVRALLSFIPTFGATARPNAEQVAQFLDDASNDLDAALALADYTTPIATTATQSVELLRTWAAVGGAWHTAVAMPQGHDSKHADVYAQRF